MKRIILFAILIKVLLFLWYLSNRDKNNDMTNEDSSPDNDKHEIEYEKLSNSPVSVQALEKSKSHYPFSRWRLNAIEHGMKQYSTENCEAIEMIFDELIADLKLLSTDATAEDKVLLFKYAVLATNSMNERIDGFIETGEREDLCELMDQITIAAGLEPEEFADGEGIASEWREW